MPYVINRQTQIKGDLLSEIPPGGMKIVHKDVFNMEMIYFFLHEWMVEFNWAAPGEPDWPEVLYLQREGAAGTELWIKWRFRKGGSEDQSPLTGNKNSEKTIFQWEMDMDWHVLGMKEVEILVKGKKLKMNSAEVEIQFYPRIMLNPEFKKEDIFNRMRDFLMKRYFKKKIDYEEDQLYIDATRLQEAIKGYFKLETFLSEPAFERFYQTRTGEEPHGPI